MILNRKVPLYVYLFAIIYLPIYIYLPLYVADNDTSQISSQYQTSNGIKNSHKSRIDFSNQHIENIFRRAGQMLSGGHC